MYYGIEVVGLNRQKPSPVCVMAERKRIYWFVFLVQFFLGAVVGAVVGFGLSVRLAEFDELGPFLILVGGCSLLCGLGAGIFGERFWDRFLGRFDR